MRGSRSETRTRRKPKPSCYEEDSVAASWDSVPLGTSGHQVEPTSEGWRSWTIYLPMPIWCRCRVISRSVNSLASPACITNRQNKLWWPERLSDQDFVIESYWCQGKQAGAEGLRVGHWCCLLQNRRAFALCAMLQCLVSTGGSTVCPLPVPLSVLTLKSHAVCKTSWSPKTWKSSPEDSFLRCFCSVCFCVMGSVWPSDTHHTWNISTADKINQLCPL